MERNSWDQVDGEPDRDYARFMAWLSLSDRRLEKAAPHLGLRIARIKELSHTWNWQERAATFDTHSAVGAQRDDVRRRLMAAYELSLATVKAARALLEGRGKAEALWAICGLSEALERLAPTLSVGIDEEVIVDLMTDTVGDFIQETREKLLQGDL